MIKSAQLEYTITTVVTTCLVFIHLISGGIHYRYDMSSSSDSEVCKVSWRRAELAVNRFAKTVETDMNRLKQMKKNIIEVQIFALF